MAKVCIACVEEHRRNITGAYGHSLHSASLYDCGHTFHWQTDDCVMWDWSGTSIRII